MKLQTPSGIFKTREEKQGSRKGKASRVGGRGHIKLFTPVTHIARQTAPQTELLRDPSLACSHPGFVIHEYLGNLQEGRIGISKA
jgi:hypothetical protein